MSGMVDYPSPAHNFAKGCSFKTTAIGWLCLARTMKEMIEVGDSKKYGPYSPGIKSRGIVWLSGQIAPEAGADIKLQTKASLDKIDQLLAAAGIDRDAVCFAQVLLADINDFSSMNEVYGEWLNDVAIKPARAAFQAAALPANALVEIVIQAVDQNYRE